MAEKQLEAKRESREQRRVIRPVCDICEDEGAVFIRMEMPGVKREDLDIQIDNNQLSISARRKNPEVEGTYLYRERAYADYHQMYTIDETIDRNNIDAKLENGVLKVALHLKEAEKPRRIEVTPG